MFLKADFEFERNLGKKIIEDNYWVYTKSYYKFLIIFDSYSKYSKRINGLDIGINGISEETIENTLPKKIQLLIRYSRILKSLSPSKVFKDDFEIIQLKYVIEKFNIIYGSSYFNFSENEFREPSTINKLCKVINDDNYNNTLNVTICTIDSLNKLLKVPNFYDILHTKKPNISFSKNITALVIKTKDYRNKSFSDLNNDEQNNIKRLNRFILEETYPQETPKKNKFLIDKITHILFSFYKIFLFSDVHIYKPIYKTNFCNFFRYYVGGKLPVAKDYFDRDPKELLNFYIACFDMLKEAPDHVIITGDIAPYSPKASTIKWLKKCSLYLGNIVNI